MMDEITDEIKIQRCCVVYNRVFGQASQYMEHANAC